MDKVVIIGASSFQNPLIVKAKDMGFETHVFAWKDGSVGERTADYFYPISIIEKEEILKKCEEIRPKAVLTIASDLAAITANYVARALGLTANSPECVYKTTNKFAMRQAMKEHGILTPGFMSVDEKNFGKVINELNFPLIVKPTDRSGSRSITKVMNEADLEAAVHRAVFDSFEKKAIVEEYVEGSEYSLESLSYGGKHYFLALTKKYTTGSPHFIENGHIQPADLDKEDKIIDVVFKALDALDIEYGAAHSEFRLDNEGNIHIIEIGARMGGDCIGSDLVRLSTGYDFVRMVLDVGLGIEPKFIKETEPKVSCIRFIMNETDLKGYYSNRELYPDHFVYESPVEAVGAHRVIDSSSRYGYYITVWDSIEEAERFMDHGR